MQDLPRIRDGVASHRPAPGYLGWVRDHAPAREATSSPGSPRGARPPRLLDRLRGALRAAHYSRRTEEAYLDGIVRAKRPAHLPAALTHEAVGRVLDRMEGTPSLVAGLLYGAGLRLLEGLRLRVKDVDFARREITVREGKGGRDRLRHPHGPGTAGPPRREHGDDLHARAESRWAWGGEPGG